MLPQIRPTRNMSLDSLALPLSLAVSEPKYVGEPTCTSPRLPQNTGITFSDDLKVTIREFKDKSKTAAARSHAQTVVERYLVERGSCSHLNPGIVEDYRLRLFNLDIDTLDNELSTEKALNSNIHDNIACAVGAVVYKGQLPGLYTPSMRERARNWFPKIKPIGEESVEGYAMKTSFTPDTNLFVMKAPRNPKKDELVHEALIGLYGLNKLRHYLPNFMYVYGYTTCSPPIIENKEVLTWCSSTNPAVSYLITENIRDATTIGEFVTDPNIDWGNMLVVLYQVFNALRLAYKWYGYTHYDLHAGNIMVRKYQRKVAIPFFDESVNIVGYIQTQYVPYIIDYGYSRITVGGVGFGKIGLEFIGIDGDVGFPMYDVYKLLGFLGQYMYTVQPDLQTPQYHAKLDILDKMFAFFGNGTLKSRVTKRLNDRSDFYAPDQSFKSITHNQYISWLRSPASDIFDPIDQNILSLIARGVLTAPINTPLDTCAFYNTVASQAGPESSLEYCEVVAALNQDSRLSAQAKQESLAWLNDNFDAEAHFRGAIKNMEQRFIENKQLILDYLLDDKNIIPNISKVGLLLSMLYINKYKEHILALIKFKDFISEFASFTKSSICALSGQNKYTANKGILDEIKLLVTEGLKIISDQRNILQSNLNFAKTKNLVSLTSDRKVREFWETEHENLILAV